MSANGSISGAEASGFFKILRSWTGDSFSLDRQMRLIEINVPIGSAAELVFEPDAGFDLGFPGGGGGGFAGPQYVAPDRRVVEDFVKGSMVSLIGTIDDAMVGPITDLYMADHRKNFDTLDREIDPSQSVVEAIRGTTAYQSIHKLRPKSVDERDWIGERRQAAAQGGLTESKQEQFAITQAATGGDPADVVKAAAISQLQSSGKAPALLDNQFRQVMQSMFSGLRR
jgi:hypothetical protein